MARKSISPTKLFDHLLDDVWLERRGLISGSFSLIHIYHDDGCPCELGVGGLSICTCHVVDYEIEPIRET